ncbi:putative AC transposase [Bienertia sinuspersici]
MEPELSPYTLEVSMGWDRKARRGVAVDKLNYMFIVADELPFSFGESRNYGYFNRGALQPQYQRVPRNTLKLHTQQACYAYRTSTFREPFVCVRPCIGLMMNGFYKYELFVLKPWKKHIMALLLKHISFFSISLDNATTNTKVVDFLKEDPLIKPLLEFPPMALLLFLIQVSNSKIILERLCEDYGVLIQLEPVGPSKGIDEYLSYQFEIEEDFHIIHWWNNHSLKLHVLARIVKGILAILASTIASESAFSACRRVLDEKRSRLAPQIIGMCVHKKD